jgi:hypothetical protein
VPFLPSFSAPRLATTGRTGAAFGSGGAAMCKPGDQAAVSPGPANGFEPANGFGAANGFGLPSGAAAVAVELSGAGVNAAGLGRGIRIGRGRPVTLRPPRDCGSAAAGKPNGSLGAAVLADDGKGLGAAANDDGAANGLGADSDGVGEGAKLGAGPFAAPPNNELVGAGPNWIPPGGVGASSPSSSVIVFGTSTLIPHLGQIPFFPARKFLTWSL